MAHKNYFERVAYCKLLAAKDNVTTKDLKNGAILFKCSLPQFMYTYGKVVSGGLPMYVNTKIKAKILGRDNNTCQYCDTQSDNLIPDHVVPFVQGGPALDYNLVACCQTCNMLKKKRVRVPNNIDVLRCINPLWADKIITMAEGNTFRAKGYKSSYYVKKKDR